MRLDLLLLQGNTTTTIAAAVIFLLTIGSLVWWFFLRDEREAPAIESNPLLDNSSYGKPIQRQQRHSRRKGYGRPVRGKVLYSSQKMEQDEEEAKKSLHRKQEEEEAKKKKEDEDFEAFKKKKFTMKDIPDFTFQMEDGGGSGLSSFI